MTTGGSLAGRRVLVTQAQDAHSSLVEQLRALGAEPLAFPVIRIAPPEDWSPVDQALDQIATYRWLVFTSQNGVDGLLDRALARGGDSSRLTGPDGPTGLLVAAVGEQTAAHLRRCGLPPSLVPADYSGQGVLEAMRRRLRPGDRVLFAKGDLASSVLPRGLREAGAEVDEVVVYRNLPETRDAATLRSWLASGRVDAVTFTSSSTVTNLLQILGADAGEGVGEGARALLAGVAVACIGAQTAATARAKGLTVAVVPDAATVSALAEALGRYLGPA